MLESLLVGLMEFLLLGLGALLLASFWNPIVLLLQRIGFSPNPRLLHLSFGKRFLYGFLFYGIVYLFFGLVRAFEQL